MVNHARSAPRARPRAPAPAHPGPVRCASSAPRASRRCAGRTHRSRRRRRRTPPGRDVREIGDPQLIRDAAPVNCRFTRSRGRSALFVSNRGRHLPTTRSPLAGPADASAARPCSERTDVSRDRAAARPCARRRRWKFSSYTRWISRHQLRVTPEPRRPAFGIAPRAPCARSTVDGAIGSCAQIGSTPYCARCVVDERAPSLRSAVELRLGEKSRCLAQDLVRPPQLANLALQLLEPLTLARQSLPVTPDPDHARPAAPSCAASPPCIPSSAAIEPIAAHCESCSCSCSKTSRTARSRTSGEYLVRFVHDSILSKNGVSGKPGAVHLLPCGDFECLRFFRSPTAFFRPFY